MNYIIPLEDFLFESKRTAKENFLDKGLISEETFNEFLDIDTTPTKKFIDTMCKFYTQGSSKEDIISTFQKASPMYIKGIIKVDIKSIKSLDELKCLVEEKQDYKTRSEIREEARDGATIVYEDDRFLVLYITTKESSIYYGKGTKWCISGDVENQWYNYTSDGSKFYFVFDYNSKFEELSKIAVQFDKYKDIHIWNSFDNKEGEMINFKGLISLGIPMSAFKYHFNVIFNIRGEYKINKNGSVDVDGDVELCCKDLTEIPVKFGKVTGDFDCSSNELTSLDGCPSYVGGNFNCEGNLLNNLIGTPKRIVGSFWGKSCGLVSLEGVPIKVGGSFNCSNNNLTSLEFAPSKVKGMFDCSKNQLTSLEFAPLEVNDWFGCSNQKNGHKFTLEEVQSVCQVGGKVYI